MKIVYHITAQLINDGDNHKESKSQILVNDQPIGIFIDECHLRDVVQVDVDKFILFATHDCTFEETLGVYLIDIKNSLIMDGLWLGLAYHTDFFTGITIENDTIKFNFISNDVWELTYVKQGFFDGIHALKEMINPIVHRRLSIKCYLKIHNAQS